MRLVKTKLVNTKAIVEKNLFAPERNSQAVVKKEAAPQDKQRIESLVLLGTMIAGGERIAIVKIPASQAAQGKGRTGGSIRRLALGDTVWGFNLTKIIAERVVFKKGGSEVELVLDFLRKQEPVQKPRKAKRGRKTRRQKTVRSRRK